MFKKFLKMMFTLYMYAAMIRILDIFVNVKIIIKVLQNSVFESGC